MALSLDQYVQQVADSGLMSEEELRAFIDGFSDSEKPADGETLAKKLVAEGKLTPFQAQTIWKKRGKSLTLGNYIVSEKLGQGGMGMVFKASHRLMKREVALKVLPSSVSKDKSAVQRFLREVEAAAKLTHPNIVAAYDADESPQGLYLIMEYVEGRDLQAIVKTQGPATVKQAMNYILQAARGLEYAHKNGVIHRDIKPANLLLDKEGAIKILDMGLARFEDSADVGTQAELTGTGMIMGTVDYMSPEQALNTKAADARADIYSLGMSLYYLLSAKPAYEGDTITARLLAHQSQPIPSLADVAKGVPEALDAVFRKMVAKKADDRYQSLKDVIADLEAIQTGDVPGSDSSSGIQPVAAGRSEDSAINSFLMNLDGGASSSGKTVKTAASTAEKSADTMASSVGDVTSSGLSKTEAFTRAFKQPKQRNVIIGGAVGAVVLLGAIIWGLSGGGGEPDTDDNGNKTVASSTRQSAETSTTANHALSFKDWDEFVEAPVRCNMDKDYCLEAWFRPTGVANFSGHLFVLGDEVMLTYRNPPAFSLTLVANGRTHLGFKDFDVSGTPLMHAAAVQHEGRAYLYINGKKVAERTYNAKEPPMEATFAKIGSGSIIVEEARISQTARYVDDFIPEKRFPSDNDTLALYHFDEGDGLVLTDSSGNGNDGRIVSAEWVNQTNGGGAATGSSQSANLPTVVGVDLERGLLAHWNFEEGQGTIVADSSGNGYDGRIERTDAEKVWSNDAPQSPLAGKGSITLGDKCLINVSGVGSFTFADEVTIAGWVKLIKPGGEYRELLRYGSPGGIRVSTNGLFVLANEPGQAVGTLLPPVPQAELPENDWYHLLARYDGKQMAVFVNGKLEKSLERTGPIFAEATGMHMVQAGRGEPAETSYDDIRIYNRALSNEEIQVLAGKATAGGVVQPSTGSSPTTLATKMIWDKLPFCAYTDLIRFQGRFYCVFREGNATVDNGKLRILASEDGDAWATATIIGRENFDVRDPHLSLMPDETLLVTAAMVGKDDIVSEQSIAKTSSDGETWSYILSIGEETWRLGNVAWQDKTGYSIGYSVKTPRKIRLYKGDTPDSFAPYVQELSVSGQPSEAALLAMDDGRLLAVVRRGGGKGGQNTTALLGTSSPPYQQWTWNDLKATLAGPSAIQLTDGRVVVGARFYDPIRTALCWLNVDDATLTEFQAFPSGDETGYPGIVEHDGMLWVSYYSSHEGNAKIYLSKLTIPSNTSDVDGYEHGPWIDLFDGKGLAQWNADAKFWSVQNGELVGKGGPHLLRTKRSDFRDVHVKAECNINTTGNSGIFVRSRPSPTQPFGYEAQIYDSTRTGHGKTGSLWVIPETEKPTKAVNWTKSTPAGQWFEMEVIAVDNRIIIKVNGETTADYVDASRASSAGTIALQTFDDQTEVRFRNIQVSELTSSATADSSGSANSPPLPAVAPFDEAQAKSHQKAWADYLGEPVETTNSIGMKLVIIPPGKFNMGEGDRVVSVTLTKPFRFGVHEVTQGQWKSLMGTEPWKDKDKEDFKLGENIAASHISWGEAMEFCKELTKQEQTNGKLPTNWEYRLPSEAEWEHACRAGTTTVYLFGNDESKLGQYAWYEENAKGVDQSYAHEVGLRRRNPWGLHDIYGNVSEWCRDWHQGALLGGTDPQGPSAGSERVLRGSSFLSPAWNCTSASRARYPPTIQYFALGFRVAAGRAGK